MTTLLGMVENRSVEVIFSAISIAEVLVRPEGGSPPRPWPDPSPHDDLFDADGFVLVQVDREIGELARGIRRRHKVKIADAIHLACAAYHNADRFITDDGANGVDGPLALPEGAIKRRDGKALVICKVQAALGGGQLFEQAVSA